MRRRGVPRCRRAGEIVAGHAGCPKTVSRPVVREWRDGLGARWIPDRQGERFLASADSCLHGAPFEPGAIDPVSDVIAVCDVAMEMRRDHACPRMAGRRRIAEPSPPRPLPATDYISRQPGTGTGCARSAGAPSASPGRRCTVQVGPTAGGSWRGPRSGVRFDEARCMPEQMGSRGQETGVRGDARDGHVSGLVRGEPQHGVC